MTVARVIQILSALQAEGKVTPETEVTLQADGNNFFPIESLHTIEAARVDDPCRTDSLTYAEIEGHGELVLVLEVI